MRTLVIVLLVVVWRDRAYMQQHIHGAMDLARVFIIGWLCTWCTWCTCMCCDNTWVLRQHMGVHVRLVQHTSVIPQPDAIGNEM